MDNTRTLLFILTAGSLICNGIAAGKMTEEFVDFMLGSLQSCIIKMKGSTSTCCASSKCFEIHLLSASTMEAVISSKDGDKTLFQVKRKLNTNLLNHCAKNIKVFHLNLGACIKAKFEDIEGGKGFAFCGTVNLSLDNIVMLEIEINCLDFKSDGSLDFRGSKDDNGAKMAFIKFKDAKGLVALVEAGSSV